MKKKIVIGLLMILIAGVILIQAQDETGCCCNTVTLEGTFQTEEECEQLDFYFAGAPEAGQTCSELCETEPWEDIPPPPPPPDCDSEDYKPEVDFEVSPVKGKKELKIFINDIPCPANYIEIHRCKEEDCTDFSLIRQTSPVTFVVDDDPNLLWNTNYSYKVIANYEVSGNSMPAIKIGNAGDIECWQKFDTSAFCISREYYDAFQEYLRSYGYLDTEKYDFRSDFAQAVDDTFSEKFNKAWFCDEQNKISEEGTNCASDETCIADEDGAKCIKPGVCELEGKPFGLYYDQTDCEGSSIDPTYCFYDKSKTSVDKCFACDRKMSCADYRSEDACQRDNCHTGDCEWQTVFEDIGIGVCVDKRFSNCKFCTLEGTPNMENLESYNRVFDQCTKRKADALSTSTYVCIYDPDDEDGKSCDEVACMDYDQQQCSSPPEGIALNPDNSILRASGDPCSIRVCDFDDTIGCFKNHEGNDEPDCNVDSESRRQCELDYLPPDTNMLKIGTQEKIDWILIKIFDKQNKTMPVQEMQGMPGYRVKLCLETSDNLCDDASEFEKTATKDRLNLNDLKLQEWQTVLFDLEEGTNTLHYFGIDASNNPEIIESITFPACNFCQGPKVLNVSVTPGREVSGKWYTYSELPSIKITFNEPAELTSALLVKGTDVISISSIPGSGSYYEFEIVPRRKITDGEYTLTFNAKDENEVLMDSPGSVEFEIDTTPGDLSFIPEDGTVLDETDVDISVISDDKIILSTFVLEEHEFITGYAVRKSVIDLLPDAETTDNKTFDAKAINLIGGKKVIVAEGEDYPGNPVLGKSRFWINQGPLIIRLAEPTWGVSSVTPFDIVVETTRPALCKYLYDNPAPVPVESFEFLQLFDENEIGVIHTKSGFNKISSGDSSKHNFFVYCEEEDGNIIFEEFKLGVDTTAPIIQKAFAQPETIIERFIPGRDIFATTLKVQTDDYVFCKYSASEVPFTRMEEEFASYEITPKRANNADINVTQDKTEYTYYVACENEAELASSTVPITFSVDTSIPFSVTSNTPRYSKNFSFDLRVETNKRAFCYYGTTTRVEGFECMNGCAEYGLSHVQPVKVNESGTFNWYVRCSTGAEGGVTQTINITVTVDETPPYMLYVDDNSSLEEYPEISYFTDQLLISFLGKDDETPIVSYSYMIKSAMANESVLNWTNTTHTDGSAFYATELNLVDGATYKVYAKAKNIVELFSEEMASDGVTINFSMTPEHCQNGILDEDETDIDCGGECAGCLDGEDCEKNSDCISGYCKDNVCTESSCNDDVKNGDETDVDCGGDDCPGCLEGGSCAEDDDCSYGFVCDFGECVVPDHCEDGELSGNEGDIDCGGDCAVKCQQGENCNDDFDCELGLSCIDNTCGGAGPGDSDSDGVPDEDDLCPRTPIEELADENGCSDSQKFSCDDEIDDAWRIRYFGSVLCDEEGAEDADPDDDGLTNIEEYKYGTNPTEPDSDFDGWNDKKEIDKGFDPLDAESHPTSKLKVFLIILLILLLVAGLGVGGYFGYQWYIEKYKPKPAPRPRPLAPLRPVSVRRPPEAIEKLRRFAAGKEREDRDWLTLGELAKKIPKKATSAEVFEKLKALNEGRLPRKDAAKLAKEIREKEPDAFALLRKITYEKLSPKEKEIVKKLFEKMKKGTLTQKQRQELFRKLRITAKWYSAHKRELEEELKKWTR